MSSDGKWPQGQQLGEQRGEMQCAQETAEMDGRFGCSDRLCEEGKGARLIGGPAGGLDLKRRPLIRRQEPK